MIQIGPGMLEMDVIRFELILVRGKFQASSEKSPLHRHASWQFDHAHRGRPALRFEHERSVLRAGESILIPPGLAHVIQWETDAVYTSCKFFWESAGTAKRPVHFPREALSKILLEKFFRWAVFSDKPSLMNAAAALHLLLSEGLEAGIRPAPKTSLEDTARHLLEEKHFGPISVRELASACLYQDESHFIRDFTRQCRLTPGKWLLSERIKKAAALLRHGDVKVREAAHALGFSDAFVFSRAFKRVTGKAPAVWKN